jgi:hypothetical protein
MQRVRQCPSGTFTKSKVDKTTNDGTAVQADVK